MLTDRHTDTHTDTYTETQIYILTHTHTHTLTHTHTHTHTHSFPNLHELLLNSNGQSIISSSRAVQNLSDGENRILLAFLVCV